MLFWRFAQSNAQFDCKFTGFWQVLAGGRMRLPPKKHAFSTFGGEKGTKMWLITPRFVETKWQVSQISSILAERCPLFGRFISIDKNRYKNTGVNLEWHPLIFKKSYGKKQLPHTFRKCRMPKERARGWLVVCLVRFAGWLACWGSGLLRFWLAEVLACQV